MEPQKQSFVSKDFRGNNIQVIKKQKINKTKDSMGICINGD